MFETILEKWEEILNVVKRDQDLMDVSYKTWLVPLKPLKFENNTLTVYFPGQSAGISYIEKRYAFVISAAISTVTGIMCDMVITNNENAAATPELAPAPEPKTVTGNKINPKYTFDSFVVGSGNKVAHAASLAVAEMPGQSWNPLYIHGGVGLGKTHLLQAIALFILHKNPNAKVMYTSCENFNNDLIDAIRNKNGSNTFGFREKYRNIDVLIIDDIQFLQKGDFIQEEIFNTFNSLYESSKQIVFASDRAPKEINNIDERISSRFLSGLTVEIESPDFETRVAILRRKEDEEHYSIDNEVINYIANKIKSNIRELEGALKKVVAYSKISNRELNIALAEETLKDHVSPEDHVITSEKIIEVVAEHFGIGINDIKSEKRSQNVAYPRQIAMYLCTEMAMDSLVSVAEALGKKDHSTVIYGRDKIKNELEKNDSLKNTIDIIKKKLSPG